MSDRKGKKAAPLVPPSDTSSDSSSDESIDTGNQRLVNAANRDNPRPYFPGIPQGWTFVNTQPEDAIRRTRPLIQPDGVLLGPPSQLPVRQTREYFERQGAIEQPADGPNSKPKGKKCLTCIQQRASCHGDAIKDSRCDCCRGIGSTSGSKIQSRVCRWQNKKDGIYTYQDHQAKTGGVKIKKNTREWRVANSRPLTTIFDLAHPVERAVLRWVITGVLATGLVRDTGDTNRELILQIAHRRVRWLANMPQAERARLFASDHEHRQMMLVLNQIYRRAERMRSAPEYQPITVTTLLRMLPPNHPSAGQENADDSDDSDE